LSGIGKGFPLRKICDSWGLGLIRTEGMPYSNDLRLRVLAAVDGGVPVRQVAALLRVSVSYIYMALNLLFGLGSISMAGVEQAIAWQAHIGGFLAVSWHSPHSIPFRSRRAAARMKAWTRRPQRSILIRSPAALCSQCHGAQSAAPRALRMRCSW
jgi:cytochrome c553